MAASKMIYVKSKVLNYYGLTGFHYEYNKLFSKYGAACSRGDKVYTGSEVFQLKGSALNELITKQEYQEATGDYSCDDVESITEQNNETYTDSGVFECDLDKAVNNGDYLFGNDKIGYFFIKINGEIIFHARKKEY